MDLELAQPIADFFYAEEQKDTDAMSRCFADSAVVRDEGRSIQGHVAIKEWQLETKKRYQHTIQPLASAKKDGDYRHGAASGELSWEPDRCSVCLYC